jgi:hypothetical protein
MRPPALRRPPPPTVTPTVPLDERELRRLLGKPTLLRRVGLVFDLTDRIGQHEILTAALAMLPPLRSHLLGLWRVAAD